MKKAATQMKLAIVFRRDLSEGEVPLEATEW